MTKENKYASLLLGSGVIAGPIYIIIGAIQILIRPGFDMRVNALSQMTLGDLGWIQVANFIIAGVLVLLAAYGIRRALSADRFGKWISILIGLYGLGMLGASQFQADPGNGFPPGTPKGPGTISTHGMMHFAFAGIGFLAFIVACFLFARYFARHKHPRWSLFSVATGIIFLVAFFGTASGTALNIFIPALWVAIFLAWVFLTAVSFKLMKESKV